MGPQPDKIGRYKILRTIGRGAMGVVYEAHDPLIDRTLAIKVVALSHLLPEDQQIEFKERFFREVRAAGALNHPCVVSIYDIGEEDGIPFMAMEYVEGRSLSERMRESGALALDEAAAIVRQVASALSFAHSREIVHRDIKPDNILISEDGRAVVTDFGVARLASSDLTRTGEILGTPYFMSPEQVLGDPVDGRADLFSLGVVFYLLLTGHRPFKGDSISSVCYHIVHSPPQPLEGGAHFPAPVAAIVERLLEKDRDDRYPDAAAFIADLEASVPSVAGITAGGGVSTGSITAAGRTTVKRPALTPRKPEEPDLSSATITLGDAATLRGKEAASAEKGDVGASGAGRKPPQKSSNAIFWILGIASIPAAVLAVILGIWLAARTDPRPPPKPVVPAVGVDPGREAGGTVEPPVQGEKKREDPPAPKRREARGGARAEAGTDGSGNKKPPPPGAQPPVTMPAGGPPDTPPKDPPAAEERDRKPAARTVIGLIFETHINRGRLVARLGEEIVWDEPFEIPREDRRKRVPMRLTREVEVPAGTHNLVVQVNSPPGYNAQSTLKVPVAEGGHRILKIEAKRFPKRLEIQRIQ